MASVRSLGLHHPTGLQHAIEEQILPANPPSNSYTWDILLDDNGDQDNNEDELLTTETCVIWSRGGTFRKAFKLDAEEEPITQALLAYFPASEDDNTKGSHPSSKSNNVPKLSKALVVFLKTQAHIYFLSGASHIVHMPFEVEYACAGPVGVIIQRKNRNDNSAPISLKFPRVPPNSFVSSQLTAFNSSQQTAFSVEGLGKPKSLSLKLSSTLDKLWDAPLEQPSSRWPRIVSLTDPLLELGLVITDVDPQSTSALRLPSQPKPPFLNPAEELLHVEQIKLPPALSESLSEPLVIAVTINREASTHTVWRLTYLKHEDPFIGRLKNTKKKATRRRSSMAPGLTSGTSTPVQGKFRESFGAPLPGKRPRKSEKVEKPIDLVSSLEQQDKEGTGAARRSSRRVSSMLARADLSLSHDRAVFADQPLLGGHAGSKRHDSQGSFHNRLSANYSHQIHPSLSSLLEAPFDVGLDEGFHNMGLDDHEFDGLQNEVIFTRIHAEALGNSNVRYSTSDQPARDQTRVFILTAPPFAIDEYNRGQLLIGIQDSVEKRLQLITLHLRAQQKADPSARGGRKDASQEASLVVTLGDLRRAQNVVDSCKLVDGNQSAILILSESMDGRHELSTQAPWSELTKISLSLVLVDDTRNLQFRGRAIDRDVRQRKSEVMDLTGGSIVGIKHSRPGGVVDVVDTEGRLHQLLIQLRPKSSQVRKVLDVCRGVLPHALGERIAAGWLHCMQWTRAQEEPMADVEWSALVTLLLALYLNLGRTDSQAPASVSLPIRKKRPASGSFGSIRDSANWRALEAGEAANSLGCPPWMLNRGWDWALEEGAIDAMSSNGDQDTSPSFIATHIALAKQYMGSPLGEGAFSTAGYMPTALGKPLESRRKIAVDVFMGLHLLLEEQKLDIMTPESTSSGRADLRVVLWQLARWLKWHDFSSIYELGIQEEIDLRHDSELNLRPAIPQPPVRPNVLYWIQSRLVSGYKERFMTPADVYYSSSRLSQAERSRDRRWDSIFPRTLLFKQFFKYIKPKSTAAEMVEAMRDAGFTTNVLQTLPEAVLVPLQDAITLCQPHPPPGWSSDLLELVSRGDLNQFQSRGKPRTNSSKLLAPTHTATWDFRMLCQSKDEVNNSGYDDIEGMERRVTIGALFQTDRRLSEAQNLLSTHKARIVRLDPQPGWPESEYLEKQKELASRIAIGTLAIPAGRALLNYSLRFPLITQKFPISGFNLNCIVKPMNTTVGVDKSLFTEEKVCWGFFHQGVAAGLAISPRAKGLDTSWILYNKPGEGLNNRHAGFLLALGLNGHLKGVAKWVAFKYLTPKHTMTSIGLLLGLAASYMGTMDSLITRLLSVHATRMLPRGAAELNLSPLTQTSGIMGIGLLYANSQHRRMSEIMLSEIEHIDEEDEEEPLRSECYRLAAGYALGFINLGKGNDLKGLHDMRLTEKLIAHATATKSVEMVHILDRAAAGAVMAITFIFMKSEDQIVARKIDIPDSILQFDYVRPDILLLRTVAKNLILWSKVEPTHAWIQKSLPGPYRHRSGMVATVQLKSTDIPLFSIVAGICFSIGLRFSGSASSKVRDLLLYYLDQFMRIARIPSTKVHADAAPPYDEELARSYACMCQDVVALSASIVMAGTGDLATLRRLRSLHGRDDPETPYGSHLAAHLAIGALFLGSGTSTFGSSNMAIASLLVAFYPIFPSNVMDNRAHLQAFRHFWVLATEQRLLVTRDDETGQPISVPVEIRMRSKASAEAVIHRKTPCLLPPLEQISSLATHSSPDWWDMQLQISNTAIRETIRDTQSLYLRRRPEHQGSVTTSLRAVGNPAASNNHLSWIYTLESLRGIDNSEHETLCTRDFHLGSAIDARLELERAIIESNDRERLEGLRLLFEWAAVRDRLTSPSLYDSQDTITDARGHDAEEAEGSRFGGKGTWWMKDSVIEDLKGKVWMVGRDGDH